MIAISFDPKKDAINRRKHGVSLLAAEAFDMDTAWIVVDDSQDYGETRYIAIGWLGSDLFHFVFSVWPEHFRAISLRDVTKAERKLYAENT